MFHQLGFLSASCDDFLKWLKGRNLTLSAPVDMTFKMSFFSVWTETSINYDWHIRGSEPLCVRVSAECCNFWKVQEIKTLPKPDPKHVLSKICYRKWMCAFQSSNMKCFAEIVYKKVCQFSSNWGPNIFLQITNYFCKIPYISGHISLKKAFPKKYFLCLCFE